MTQTRDLIKKMADFFTGEEFYEKGEDARLELTPDDVRCMNLVIKACGNAVSRQAVKEQMIKYGFHAPDMTVTEFVEDLPSVRPQEPKTETEDSSTGSTTESTTDSSTVSLGVFEQVKWERDVALDQLKELGYGLGEKIRTDEDCISRKAVLDLAEKGVLVSNGNYKSVCKAINELPSVKPKFTDEEIQTMQDLEQAQIQKAYEIGKAEGTEVKDCISREEAIEIIENWLSCGDYNEGERNIMKVMQSILHELPSVKPNIDVDALINKIDADLSWCLFDGSGNRNDLYKRLVRIIKEFFAVNLIIYTKDDCAERVQIECNTVEWLILNKALRQFVGNEENHKTDRKIAGEMCQKEPVFIKEG